jgi:hypothetical protein
MGCSMDARRGQNGVPDGARRREPDGTRRREPDGTKWREPDGAKLGLDGVADGRIIYF